MRPPACFLAVAACCAWAVVASAAPPQQCRFTYRPLTVGDEARETIRFSVDLKTILSQDGQVVSITDQAVERDEHSAVLRLPAEPGQAAKVRITYLTSAQKTTTPGGE